MEYIDCHYPRVIWSKPIHPRMEMTRSPRREILILEHATTALKGISNNGRHHEPWGETTPLRATAY